LKIILSISAVVLVFLPIEVLLMVRVWAQVTSQPLDTEAMQELFAVTDSLASPFEPLTGSPPLRATGVVDFTVLVAIEAYFVAMLVAVGLVLWFGLIWTLLSRHRTRELPAFVRAMNAPRGRRRAWQPVKALRRPGRFYVALRLQDDAPAHQKAGLGPV
jgi:hypothetical protein